MQPSAGTALTCDNHIQGVLVLYPLLPCTWTGPGRLAWLNRKHQPLKIKELLIETCSPAQGCAQELLCLLHTQTVLFVVFVCQLSSMLASEPKKFQSQEGTAKRAKQ